MNSLRTAPGTPRKHRRPSAFCVNSYSLNHCYSSSLHCFAFCHASSFTCPYLLVSSANQAETSTAGPLPESTSPSRNPYRLPASEAPKVSSSSLAHASSVFSSHPRTSPCLERSSAVCPIYCRCSPSRKTDRLLTTSPQANDLCSVYVNSGVCPNAQSHVYTLSIRGM